MTPHLTLSKKILSILLSILLVVAFVPAVAFAGNDANDEVVAFDETVADRPVYDADDSFGGVDSSGDTEGSSGGTEITTWPDPSESDNGITDGNGQAVSTTDATDNSQASGQSEENMNSWRFTDGQLTPPAQEEESGISPYSLRSAGTNGSPVARGIDVSSWQGNIDWNAVKNSGQVGFVIIRCGWGNNDSSQNDGYWLRNASECKRLGIPFGVYIYSYACNTSYAASEADHVLAQLSAAGLSPSDVSYPIYLDLEQETSDGKPCGIDNWNNRITLSNGDLANIASTFCSRIANAGYTPGVYANLNWWNNYLTSSVFDNYERWVAQYNSSCWYKGNYSLWQYSSSGSVPGISGNVDMNYYYGAAGSVPDSYETPDTPYVQTIADGEYYITSCLNNYSVLDISGGSKADGGNLQLYQTNKTVAQRFKLKREEATGFYTIINSNSGKALGLKSMRGGYDSNVAQYSKNDDDSSQKWIIEASKDGSYIIKSAVNSSYALD